MWGDANRKESKEHNTEFDMKYSVPEDLCMLYASLRGDY